MTGLLARVSELVCREQCVHRAGAKAFQIKSDELEAQRFEDCGELGCHVGVQSALQFFSGDLDADDVAVMPYSKLPEAKARIASSPRSATSSASRVTGRPYSIRDERQAEAGLSQMRSPAWRASSRISCLVSRALSSRRRRGAAWQPAGPGESRLDRHVHAVSDFVEASIGAKLFHHCEQFVLSLKAALPVVPRIFGTVEFGGGEHFDRNPLLVGESNRIA